MPLPDDDMKFGGDDFTQPDLSVPDGLLDMGGDEEQLDIDPRQLGLTTPDISPAQTGPSQTPDEVAQGVEGVLLNLLQGGQHDMIMVMAGERPATAAIHHPGLGSLRMAYASAVGTNPALRWYAKFAALLPREKFTIREGSLRINMPEPMFRKVVTPFLSEFRADWAQDSTITAAVRGMAASLAASDLRAKQQHLARGVRAQSNVEATDLDVANMAFGDSQIPDVPQSAEGVPFPAQPAAPVTSPAAADPGPVVPRLPISLTDLSLKAVVDHIATLDGDDDTMMTHLLDQGFPRSRANEILAMLRYKRVSQARRKALFEPQGNRGCGSVEFDFR